MNKFIIIDAERFEIPFEQPIKGTAFSSTQKRWNSFLKSKTDLGFSVYGFTSLCPGILQTEIDEYSLKPYMFFSTNCFRDFQGQDAFLIFIERYFTTNMIGGPIENIGRLKYIDGCTDSILLPPIIKGAPCLNALFFPKGTNQTYHTHPSFRLGMVIKGKGTCELKDRCIDLIPGKVFMIPQDFLHRFQTNDEELVVVAFHPDSDFGPENLDHPMINKTVVQGISANKIKDIQTL